MSGKIRWYIVFATIFFSVLGTSMMAEAKINEYICKFGDINNDGRINDTDTELLLRHMYWEEVPAKRSEHPEWQLTGRSFQAADITQDGIVNISDELAILRHIEAVEKNVHPEWRLITVTMYTYYSRPSGDSVIYNAIDCMLVRNGSKYSKLYSPTKSGYTFQGWKKNSKSGASVTKNTTVSDLGDVQLFGAMKAIPVSNIVLTPSSSTVTAGQKTTVYAAVYPADAATKSYSFTSSNTDWAAITGDGVVTTKAAGAGHTVTITAKALDGSGVTASVKITIKSASAAASVPDVLYQTHVQNVGWQSYVKNGSLAGTTGRSLRLEGIRIKLGKQPYSGSIQYRTHIQNIGWESEWKSNGAMSGTSGRSLRLEAIQIKLTGTMASYYDVYYRVHAQNIGWMGWAKNGQSAGTAGYSYRLEAIQVRLVRKGTAAPGATTGYFRQAIGWQNSYYNYLKSGGKSTDKFILAYIDGDSIPELLIADSSTLAANLTIISYKNGRLYTMYNGNARYSGLSYSRKGSKVCLEGGGALLITDSVYTVSNNKLSLVRYFLYYADKSGQHYEIGTSSKNTKKVSKSYYESERNKLLNSMISFNLYASKKSLKSTSTNIQLVLTNPSSIIQQ